jgi:hypothetical protein
MRSLRRILPTGKTFRNSFRHYMRRARTLTFENVLCRLEESNFQKEAIESLHNLDALERVYRFLLGEKIRYQTGDQGPEFDLFFLCILMNCKELAFELWKQCSFPVGSAICAVRLLHMCPPSAHAHIQ